VDLFAGQVAEVLVKLLQGVLFDRLPVLLRHHVPAVTHEHGRVRVEALLPSSVHNHPEEILQLEMGEN